MHYQCTPSELTGIALVCSDVSSLPALSLCSSRCATQLKVSSPPD
eukprot:COSAG01_NODE_71294_length_256_cov_0.662420_1_plen_44_part_01